MCTTGDWIHVRGIALDAVLGVYPAERNVLRPITVDVDLQCDVRNAGHSDHLADTLNYELVEALVLKIAGEGRYQLVEALAGHIAEACLTLDRVEAVRVVVDKPGALVHARSVAIEVFRRKSEGTAP